MDPSASWVAFLADRNVPEELINATFGANSVDREKKNWRPVQDKYRMTGKTD